APKTLPARYYTDPELFRAEIERLYFHRWIHAGREERLVRPGDYFLCNIAGESIIVTRDAGGAVRAFYNVCRHRGTRMCMEPYGPLPGRIRFPYHCWTYGLDGALISAPNLDQPGFSRQDYPLHSIRTWSWDGHVFLNFATDGKTLDAQLGDLPAKFSAWRMG